MVEGFSRMDSLRSLRFGRRFLVPFFVVSSAFIVSCTGKKSWISDGPVKILTTIAPPAATSKQTATSKPSCLEKMNGTSFQCRQFVKSDGSALSTSEITAKKSECNVQEPSGKSFTWNDNLDCSEIQPSAFHKCVCPGVTFFVFANPADLSIAKTQCETPSAYGTCAWTWLGAGSTPTPTPTATPVPVQTVAPTPLPTKNVRVRWEANREKAVNQVGGGYRIYYSKTSEFALASAPSLLVPYESGATAPTSAVLALSKGLYYIKVVAISALHDLGETGGSSSEASQEVSVAVP
jgi:hypothetical protein